MTEVDVKHCLKTVLQKIEDASKKRLPVSNNN